ncbi:hypothetical protein VCO01S_31940 [Vibrio comitans NBRC 102076]|uniref:Uncharacterized protein n=1 Tax=Vibrio comitans NBRC 102076 TaxID=1219078 RepID=A0A4Y3IR31_9VIBR|nr:hypothetical protein VCO01S_31940 [Vibrio comitans NBRC 102076]
MKFTKYEPSNKPIKGKSNTWTLLLLLGISASKPRRILELCKNIARIMQVTTKPFLFPINPL